MPDQLKEVGYTNDPHSMIIDPPLTSVEQFPYVVGEQTATLIINLIQQKRKPGRSYLTITTPIELIERASSKKKK